MTEIGLDENMDQKLELHFNITLWSNFNFFLERYDPHTGKNGPWKRVRSSFISSYSTWDFITLVASYQLQTWYFLATKKVPILDEISSQPSFDDDDHDTDVRTGANAVTKFPFLLSAITPNNATINCWIKDALDILNKLLFFK